MKKIIILFFAIFFTLTSAFSQTNKKFIDTGSVKNQFDYLINKSNRYEEYKVVKINWLQKLKSNIEDSLAISKKEISTNYTLINTQKDTIINLKTSLKNSKETINTLNSEKQSISFLGIPFHKVFFKILLFTIIGLLIALLALFFSKFKQSNSITKQTKQDLRELENEYNTHRTKALEREQKAMRKLQDELNKPLWTEMSIVLGL